MTFKEHAEAIMSDKSPIPLTDRIAEGIRQAVLAEQERCAKDAEAYSREFKNDPLKQGLKDTPNYMACQYVAWQIRALRRGNINSLE